MENINMNVNVNKKKRGETVIKNRIGNPKPTKNTATKYLKQNIIKP